MTSDPQATAAVDMRAHIDLDARYRLEGVIGSGGVATVLRATDLLLDRAVAVKFLKDATDCPEDRARFLLETQTLARLSHPGLVTMLDAGTFEDKPYLVMELVDGPPLSDLLTEPLDLDRTADIGAQLARALAHAHGHGVVHRDVKPGNVLIRSDGRVKLADFGIARLIGERSEHTQTGIVVGSPHFLAPEQVGFEEITPAVDIYALGLLLRRAVSGRHAFEGSTIEIALARLSVDPEIPADLPSGWRSLLVAMTARRPEDRPTAAEVAERLDSLDGDRTTTKVFTPVSAPAVRAERVPGVRRLTGRLARVSPVAVAAAALTIALFVAAALAGPGGPDPVAPAAAADAEAPMNSVPQQVSEAGAVMTLAADVRTAKPAPARLHADKPKQANGKPGKHKKPNGKGKGKAKGKR